jgi:hypothetical protein
MFCRQRNGPYTPHGTLSSTRSPLLGEQCAANIFGSGKSYAGVTSMPLEETADPRRRSAYSRPKRNSLKLRGLRSSKCRTSK